MENCLKQFLVTNDGAKIFIRHWLPEIEGRQAILCLHGMNSHSGYFAQLGLGLAKKGHAVFALDLRGNGLSGEQGDVENLERQIADIKFVLEYIHTLYPDKPVYLLGHSLGAGYALRFIYTYPDDVTGAILLAPAVRPIFNFSLHLLWFTFTVGFRFILSPRSHWDTTIAWTDALRKSELGKMILNDPACVKEFTYRYMINLPKVSSSALLHYATSVNLPVLIIQGGKDGVVVPNGAQSLYERLRSSKKEIQILPDADHDLFGLMLPNSDLSEKAREVVEMIHQWLLKRAEL